MSLKNKRVLITGISGFVGSHLASHLLDEGAVVHGLDFAEAPPHRRPPDAPEIRLHNGDIRNISAIDRALHDSRPDIIFHLAAHSFDPSSFTNPLDVVQINSLGTANLLEAVRRVGLDCKVVFASSSEVYGLVISSEEQLRRATERYGFVFPAARRVPELPIGEENPTRPISPYGVSKLHGEYLMRNYFHSYRVRTVVSRAFNHEGAGRGPMFVTSVIAGQVARLMAGNIDRISIGNVSAMRDWSHVDDITRGYCLLAEHGEDGGVYNQGSQRTNSVLSYLLLCLEEMGCRAGKVETLSGKKEVENPTEPERAAIYGCEFDKTRIDQMMLNNDLEYTIEDIGLNVYTARGKVLVEFDRSRFRPADVPILLSDIGKIRGLGFEPRHTLRDIARDQLHHLQEIDKREQRHGRG